NYKLQNDSTQSVNLTEEDPDQVIIFYYNKVLGTITIKYIDINLNTDIYQLKTIENLSLGTYTYGAINISGYVLSDNEIKTVTITETSPSATITFKYAEILGTVTIKYIDNSFSTELSEADTFTDLKLGTYSYTYKNIPGYSLANDSTQIVELTDDNHDVEIEFKYNKLLGSVTIKYIDSSSLNEIGTATVISNLSLGTYSYTAKSFEGYEVIGDSRQSITLNDSNLNPIISFNYSRISGSITIEYLDSSTLSEIAPSTTISNIALGSYTYDAIYIDNYEILNDSSISITLTTTNPNQIISFKYNKIEIPNDLNLNEVPYISTYYIKPVVKPDEEVFIDYYITDYYYKEYMEKYNLKNDDWEDDNWTEKVWNNETFTVTVRVDGQYDKLYHNLKAGNHKVSLGSFTKEGEQKFSILCTDKYGRNSHELFNFFLVQGDVEIKEYVMTNEDLVTYNIKNTDDYEEKIYVKVDKLIDSIAGTKIEEIANTTVVPSHKYICFIGTTETDTNGNPIMQTTPARFWLNTIVKYSDDYDKNAVLTEATNTRIGLQKLLDDKKAAGYNRLLLLPGIYRIDHLGTIYVPDRFTINMNGATLKENQFTGDSSLMISLDATFDSHVINGNIEGDYFSHDYANSTNNSEWCMGASISGLCKYSSFENMKIKNITGYGGSSGISKKSGYIYFAQALGNVFKLGDISIIDGSIISSTERQSTDFINISSYTKYNYISINKYLGYQGMLGGSWSLILHFYDNSKKYIKSISTFQYRRTRIPSNSYFMKVTILSPTASSDFWIAYFKVPCHCNFTNIEFNNCRCVGLAQAAMNDMLVNNCEFTLNGQSGAFCAYDAEDGWDQMQDITIKNCNFINNYRNDLLTCAGHNFIIDGQVNGKIYMWERTRSSVIINCNNTNITLQSGGANTIVKHGIYRVYNNNFTEGNVANNLSKRNYCIGSLSGVIYNSIIGAYGDNSFYNNCTINISTSFYCKLYKIIMINCILKPTLEFTDRYKILFITGHDGSYYFKNCSFLGKCALGDNADFYSGHFIKCNFENVNIFPNVNANSNDLILFENCSINCSENNLIYYRPFAYTKGTSTNLKFKDCIITISKTT
ncbi:collagen binding domain-containing protein, partial [uncultured Clostridium sp.]|uniref:MSCRAMM family protein n=1 Tax=uncultured Clostridium sp. TaxID=59620 RepID=UPI002595BD19